MDVLTPEQRSRNMRAIKGRDTRPELIVRGLVHGLGYRFRLHGHSLPGRPDLVLRRLRVVIFVHGCFWHRHRCRYGRAMPATRPTFWKAKFASNVDRDRRTARTLRHMGWRVLVIWECQTRDADRLRARLAKFLATSDKP